MFGIENFPGFIIAAVILNITPGTDTFYVLTRCVAQGRQAGFISVAGILTGCVVHVLCAAFGLSVILSTSLLAFNLIKWAGALYLVYLGIKTLASDSRAFENTKNTRAHGQDLLAVYRQGIFTNVLNPKVALFFLSFLPQFIHTDQASGPVPFLILGATFLATSTTWFLILATVAGKMTKTLRENQRIEKILHKISGMVFIAFGLKLAFNPR